MKSGGVPKPLDAVMFDMDGTLLDTERLHHEAMAAAAAALGYCIEPSLFAAMVGVHRELNQAMLVERLGRGFPVDAFYADADARFGAAAADGIPYRPGVRRLLDRLATNGIRCAVATSTESPRAEQRLASTGLLSYFEAVVTRSDVVHPKPAPDPYLLAAERLNVRPRHCLAVEDSLNGIRAAAAAGMATIMVPDLIPPDDETNRLTIATMESLEELELVLFPQPTTDGTDGFGILATLLLALCTIVLTITSPAALAQSLPSVTANSTAPATARDPYGRETPRGLADGLVAALAAKDYDRASEYFDLSGVARSRRAEQGATYAQRLQAALDAGGSLVPFLQLSNDPGGHINDQLPLDEERIGRLPARAGSANSDGTPLLARAVPQDSGQVWQISASTLAALPAVTALAVDEQDRLRGILPTALTSTQVGGAPISDWIILLVMAAGFYLVVRLLFGAALGLVRRLKHGHEDSRSWRLLHAASSPLSLYVAVLLFLGATRSLHVAIVARQFVSRYAGAVLLVSFAWFLWRLIDVVADFAAVRMERTQRKRARSILVFARRGVKILLG